MDRALCYASRFVEDAVIGEGNTQGEQNTPAQEVATQEGEGVTQNIQQYPTETGAGEAQTVTENTQAETAPDALIQEAQPEQQIPDIANNSSAETAAGQESSAIQFDR